MPSVTLKPDKVFRVGKILCVGQNYTKHVKEMNAKKSADPVLFLKPATSLLHEGEDIVLPAFSNEVHHEVELALLVNKNAKNIPGEKWQNYITGAGIALDLTLRDLQQTAKQKGLPWSVSKGFDGACPISEFTPLSEIGDIDQLNISLHVNEELRQAGFTGDMIFKTDRLVAYMSTIFTLEPGDIILTGTPAGVSKLNPGDIIRASIERLGSITFHVR